MRGKNILTAAIVSVSIFFNTAQISNATVYRGSQGSEVVELQQLLTWWGYLRAPIDGVAGDSTINALLNFQYDAGIYGDGVAGYDTFAVLRQEIPIPSEQPNFAPLGSKNISAGMQGAGVTDLQKNLIAWGYYHGAADGYMGTSTVTALKDFQADAGLPVDGIAGESTWHALAGNIPMKKHVEEVIEQPKSEPVVEQKIEVKPEPEIETKIEPKIETPVEQKIETTIPKIETKIETNIDKPAETVIETNLQDPKISDKDKDKKDDSKSKSKLKKKEKNKVEDEEKVEPKPEEKPKKEKKSTVKFEEAIPVPDELPEDFFNQRQNIASGEIPKNGHALFVEATAYSPYDMNSSPYTARGHRVRRGVVAVDPNFIPLGTKMFIPGYGNAIADDIGADIKGNRIDVAFDTSEEAMVFGRQQMEIYLLE